MNTIQYAIEDLISTLSENDCIEQYNLQEPDTKELYLEILKLTEHDETDPYYQLCGYCYDCNQTETPGVILMAKLDQLGSVEWMDCICPSCCEIYKSVLMEYNIRFNRHSQL